MLSLAHHYARQFRIHVATFHPVWQPGDKLQAGDFGIIEDGVFVRQGHLSEFGEDLPLEVERAAAGGSVSFHSDKGFSSRAHVTANAHALGKAEAELAFSQVGGILVQARDLEQASLTKVAALLTELCKPPQKLTGEQVFVSQVQTAKAAVILISTSGGWRVSAQGEASAIERLDLLSAGVEFTTVDGEGYVRQLSTGVALPLMLRLYGRRGFFRPSWALLSDGPEGRSEDDDWIEVTPEDLSI